MKPGKIQLVSAIELRERRLLLGLSQAKLAAKLGVTSRTIEYWEAGKSLAMPTMLHLALCHLERLNSAAKWKRNAILGLSEAEVIEVSYSSEPSDE